MIKSYNIFWPKMTRVFNSLLLHGDTLWTFSGLFFLTGELNLHGVSLLREFFLIQGQLRGTNLFLSEFRERERKRRSFRRQLE